VPKPHFGLWLRRVREKLGLTQGKMAKALGLKSYISVRDIEQRDERSMRGTTAEALLEMLGYRDEEDLDRAWRVGEIPDLAGVRRRLAEAQALAEAIEHGKLPPEIEFDARLVADVFRWIAAHPAQQRVGLLRNVAQKDAASVATALVQRMGQSDAGGGKGDDGE
jgi:transcriptional regulator with XRE-family HTH domain